MANNDNTEETKKQQISPTSDEAATKSSPRQVFDLINSTGRQKLINFDLKCEDGSASANLKPIWLDEQRFAEGKEAIKKFLIGLVSFGLFNL